MALRANLFESAECYLLFSVLTNVLVAGKNKRIKGNPDPLVYFVTDTMPEYPGGKKALMQYIHDAVPFHTEGNVITGNVLVEFIVEKNGSVSNARIIKKLACHQDNEALKIILSLATWKPGMKDGKPVRVKIILPVAFTIR